MSKQFIIILVVIIGGLFGLLMFNKDKAADNGSSSNQSVQATNHVSGKTDAKVTLIEYGDFQCPACGAYHPIVKQLKSDYADKISFQFRHYPLTQIHPNAFISSRAAEAAGKQNKFFEMHDLLYEQQQAWSSTSDPTQTFVAYASQLQLDVEKFKTDLSAESTGDAINADLRAGQQISVSSTPTFILNGKKLDKSPTTVDDFKKLIDEELAKVSQ
jgi:protein-disulfide isomerase